MHEYDSGNIKCMADCYMLDYEREYAAFGRLQRERELPILLAAVLKELRCLRAELKAEREAATTLFRLTGS
jgi:hypothetical protein